VSLDAPDEHARRVIRAALADALRGEPRSVYRVHVARDGAGGLDVRIEPELLPAADAGDGAATNDGRGAP
jgi:hypothetical protein